MIPLAIIPIIARIKNWWGGNWKALLAMLAFSSVVSVGVGAYKIGKQGERLDNLVAINRELASDLKKAKASRDAEIARSIEMQETITLIAGSSDEANRRLRELEKTNAEIKTFLANRTPDAMRGLLTGDTRAKSR